MKRKTIIFAIAMILGVAGISVAVLGLLLRHVPNFYRVGIEAPGETRQQHSHEFISRSSTMMNGIRNRYDEGWGGVFSTAQVNAYLQEDFIRGAGGDENLPEGFRDLRVSFEDDRLRLGVRYGTGFWSTIISIDLKIWLIAGETNLLALEIVSLRAGGLPISPQVVLNQITEAALRSNIEVKWYHRKGNPVATLKLQADLRLPTIQLQTLLIQQGQLVIGGRPIDSAGKASATADTK